jgi:plastocyanin
VRRAFVVVAVLFALVLTQPADAANKDVTIQYPSFTPATVTVNTGDTVTWTNKDTIAHTATADDGSFDTSPTCDAAHSQDESCLKPNEPFSVTFLSAGTWTYHCKIHKNMTGTVVVNGESTTTTEPPTSAVVTSTTRATTTSSTTTTTSSTTTTTSSTTTTSMSTTTTTTTLLSSASAPITVTDKGGGGGSSAVPWLLGGAVAVAALAGLAYWLWWRSGEPVHEGPDWTQEPPPTAQGPRI